MTTTNKLLPPPSLRTIRNIVRRVGLHFPVPLRVDATVKIVVTTTTITTNMLLSIIWRRRMRMAATISTTKNVPRIHPTVLHRHPNNTIWFPHTRTKVSIPTWSHACRSRRISWTRMTTSCNLRNKIVAIAMSDRPTVVLIYMDCTVRYPTPLHRRRPNHRRFPHDKSDGGATHRPSIPVARGPHDDVPVWIEEPLPPRIHSRPRVFIPNPNHHRTCTIVTTTSPSIIIIGMMMTI
jgi:hypothetical protein